jgi:GDPmannose 4,6-dehydratase
MKKALVTGITGQDGSYLAELLLARGYEVHGIVRRASTFNTGRIDQIFQDPHEEEQRLVLHYGDLITPDRLTGLVLEIQPDEVYNLAAQSHVRVSFDIPEYTGDVVALGTVRLLEAVRAVAPEARFFQASSSEMFGSTPPPQNEASPFHPRSPYAVAKLYAHWATLNYREAYGMKNRTGILFNHESPRRGETFVTRKIAMAIPRLLKGDQRFLYLGNLAARRDWGHAHEYIEAIYRIVQHPQADDFVIGTGEDHSVEEFLEEAFRLVGLGWEEYVRIDSRYYRPSEVDVLRADASKAERILGWRPKVTFKNLVREMVAAELAAAGLSLQTGMSQAPRRDVAG